MSIRAKILAVAAAALAITILAGCVNTAPVVHPEITPGPTRRPELNTPLPEDTDTVTPAPTDDAAYDANGVLISGAEHYTRYLTFRNIIVYEEDSDTFLDGMISNSYCYPITCAIDVVYRDGDKEIARSRLQTRDGNYLLVLEPGETVVLARILTDMTLTDRDFTFEYDLSTGIYPVTSKARE